MRPQSSEWCLLCAQFLKFARNYGISPGLMARVEVLQLFRAMQSGEAKTEWNSKREASRMRYADFAACVAACAAVIFSGEGWAEKYETMAQKLGLLLFWLHRQSAEGGVATRTTAACRRRAWSREMVETAMRRFGTIEEAEASSQVEAGLDRKLRAIFAYYCTNGERLNVGKDAALSRVQVVRLLADAGCLEASARRQRVDVALAALCGVRRRRVSYADFVALSREIAGEESIAALLGRHPLFDADVPVEKVAAAEQPEQPELLRLASSEIADAGPEPPAVAALVDTISRDLGETKVAGIALAAPPPKLRDLKDKLRARTDGDARDDDDDQTSTSLHTVRAKLRDSVLEQLNQISELSDVRRRVAMDCLDAPVSLDDLRTDPADDHRRRQLLALETALLDQSKRLEALQHRLAQRCPRAPAIPLTDLNQPLDLPFDLAPDFQQRTPHQDRVFDLEPVEEPVDRKSASSRYSREFAQPQAPPGGISPPSDPRLRLAKVGLSPTPTRPTPQPATVPCDHPSPPREPPQPPAGRVLECPTPRKRTRPRRATSTPLPP